MRKTTFVTRQLTFTPSHAKHPSGSSFKKTYPEGMVSNSPDDSQNQIKGSQNNSQIGQNDQSRRDEIKKETQFMNQLLFTEGDEETKTFEDGRKSRIEFQKLQITDAATGALGIIGIGLAVLAYDVEWEEKDEEKLQFLLWILFVLTFATIFASILRHKQRLRFLQAKNIYSHKETLKSTGLINSAVMESLMFLIQPYPFLTHIRVYVSNDFYSADFYYHVNDFLSLLITLRLYIVFRFILNHTIYRSPSAQRINDMYGADNDYLYASRCLMKESPFLTSMVLLVGSIFVFGYLVRICERPLDRLEVNDQNFGSYWTGMWCVILTMTTVGYGDFYPRTILGRLIIFINCIWGVFIVSLMVVTLNNVLTMEPPEEKSLTVLKRLTLRKQEKEQAAYILTHMGRIGLNNKKVKDEAEREKLKKFHVHKIRYHLSKFRQVGRQIRNLDDIGSVAEEMTRQFEFLRGEFRTIQNRQFNMQEQMNNISKMFGLPTKKNFNTEDNIKAEAKSVAEVSKPPTLSKIPLRNINDFDSDGEEHKNNLSGSNDNFRF